MIFEVILQISKGGAGGLVFVTPSNLMMIFRQMVYTGIIAFGLTLVMLTGNIDLSVGNMLTFTCCIAATVMMKTDNAALTVLATLGVGLLCGLFNGVLVSYVEAEQLHHHPWHQLHLQCAGHHGLRRYGAGHPQ